MLYPIVDWNICEACNPCQAYLACNTRAIFKVDPDTQAVVDQNRCMACGHCLPACVHNAISLENPQFFYKQQMNPHPTR